MIDETQRAVVDFIHERSRAALWIEPGAGKTRTVLTFISEILNQHPSKRFLVVAPPKPMIEWEKEAKIIGLPYKLTLVRGPEANRVFLLNLLTPITVISEALFEWLCDAWSPHFPYTGLVIDEVSSFRSPSSKKFKAAKRVIGKTQYRVIMSGTPNPEGARDLYALGYLIDEGTSLGRTFAHFCHDFMYMGANGKWYPKWNAMRRIAQRMSRYTVALKLSDFGVELPPIEFAKIEIEPPTRVRKAYQKYAKGHIDSLKNPHYVNRGGAIAKLMQLAHGFYYREDKSVELIDPFLFDWIQDVISIRCPLIFAVHRYVQDSLVDMGIKSVSPDACQDWNEGRIDRLVGHAQSSGQGLNLQKNGDSVIFAERTWRMDLYEQAYRRVWRRGRTEPVEVVNLVVKGTIDEAIHAAIQRKNTTYENFIKLIVEFN